MPSYVTPIQKGKHGEPVFFPAWRVLRVSGENVTAESMDNTAQARFGRRARSLEEAGYFVGGHAAALAGDTLEIVERKLGSRSQQARAGGSRDGQVLRSVREERARQDLGRPAAQAVKTPSAIERYCVIQCPKLRQALLKTPSAI